MSHQFLFYVEPAEVKGAQIRFSSSESHHIRNVLRLRQGDHFQVTDGRGNLYHVLLDDTEDGLLIGRILQSQQHEKRSPLPILLTLPCLKNERWQTALEGACEMGVEVVFPVNFELSNVKWTPPRLEKARRKAVEILKQSGGSRLTNIADIFTLQQVLKEHSDREIWYADREGGELTADVSDGALIVIGPEAGFDSSEMEFLIDSGAKGFSLGSRRLRSEIAVIAALSQVAVRLNI